MIDISGWGRCHVEITQQILSRLLTHKSVMNKIRIITASASGTFISPEEEIFICEIASPYLTKGYHGTNNLIIKPRDYYLKRDADT